jgi:hypothetical protein
MNDHQTINCCMLLFVLTLFYQKFLCYQREMNALGSVVSITSSFFGNERGLIWTLGVEDTNGTCTPSLLMLPSAASRKSGLTPQ